MTTAGQHRDRVTTDGDPGTYPGVLAPPRDDDERHQPGRQPLQRSRHPVRQLLQRRRRAARLHARPVRIPTEPRLRRDGARRRRARCIRTRRSARSSTSRRSASGGCRQRVAARARRIAVARDERSDRPVRPLQSRSSSRRRGSPRSTSFDVISVAAPSRPRPAARTRSTPPSSPTGRAHAGCDPASVDDPRRCAGMPPACPSRRQRPLDRGPQARGAAGAVPACRSRRACGPRIPPSYSASPKRGQRAAARAEGGRGGGAAGPDPGDDAARAA